MFFGIKSLKKTVLGKTSTGSLAKVAVVLTLLITPCAASAEPVEVSQYVTITTANERSTMDRRTRMITSTADVTITNSSDQTINAPFHAVIEILDTAYSNVSMPDALGGDGIDPFGKYYYDLSTSLQNDILLPEQSITFQVTFVRFYTIRFRYNVIVYGNVEAGPLNQPPTAVLAGPDEGIVGQALSFNGWASHDPDGNDLNCTWNFGDGGTADGFDASHSYGAANTYTVTLTVDDGHGGSDTATLTVTITAPNVPPSANAGPDVTYTMPFDQISMIVTLDGSGSEDADGSIAQYIWSGDLDPLDQVKLVVTLSEGTYTFTLVVVDDDGALSDPDTVAISVNPAPNRPPVADVDGPYSAEINQSIEFDGSGSSDPDGDTLTYAWDFGDGTTGTGIAPTHTFNAPGTYTVILTVTDTSGASAGTQTEAEITTVNNPPAVNPIDPQTVKEKVLLSFAVSGSDPDGDDLAFSARNLPEQAVFDSSNRMFYWTPTYEQAGSYTVTFHVTDTRGLSASTEVVIDVIDVNRQPILDPVPDRHIAEAKTLTFQIHGRDPDGDDLTYAAANLPADEAFDAETRTFSWTPPSGYAGVYQVEFSVTDGRLSDRVDGLIYVHLYDADHSPDLSPVNARQVDENQLLTFDITGSDPENDPLTFTVAGLPAGAAFDSTPAEDVYRFAWTPTYDQAGPYTVIFAVTDPDGLTDSVNVDITVNNVNRPPVFDLMPPRKVSETKPISFQISAIDPDEDDLTYTAGSLPEGATFDALAQMFSWTPGLQQAGTYVADFTVTDGDLAETMLVQIDVLDFDVDHSPSLTVDIYHEVEEGQTLEFEAAGSDPDGDVLNFETVDLPAGSAFEATADSNIYQFAWTPGYDQAGTYRVNFSVVDTDNLADTVDVEIMVIDVNRPPLLETIEDQQVDENADLTIQLVGSDPDGDTLTFGAQDLPAGAVLDGAGGKFLWTPSYDQAGNYSVIFNVSDGELSAEQAVAIEVGDVNRPPTIITTALPNARVDQIYQHRIIAEDKDGDPPAFALTDAPAEAIIDLESGELTWTPGIADIGDHPVSVEIIDGRGGSDSRDYVLAVPDTIPPNVFISAPATAIPGTPFEAAVKATDNILISSVEVEAADCAVQQSSTVPDQWEITPSSGLTIGDSVILTATATDENGNTARTTTSVTLVGTPDIEPPQIVLIAPPVVTQNQNILVTAAVSDNVGVSRVRFFTADDADPFAVAGGLNQAASYLVTEPAGATIQFTATAVDTSGNTADAQAQSRVVEPDDQVTPPDLAEPVVDLATPPSVAEDAPLAITVNTDESCLAQVDIYVNHTLAASYTAPEGDTFDVSLPPGLEPGMNALIEVVVTDCAGNQTTVSQDNWISVTEAGQGVVAGEVYNDGSGLPLAGAIVAFENGDGSPVAAITDEKGRFSLVAKADAGRILITKDGFTAVERTGVQVSDNQGLEMFDARLTPVQEAEQALSSVIGGAVKTPFSLTVAGLVPVLTNSGIDPANIPASEIKCEIPAGAIGTNGAFALTQISPQGLAGILPGGWSPLAALDILPHNISFQVPAALTIPSILGYTGVDGIVLAIWDESEHVWRTIGPAAVSADGSTISGHVSQTGQYAFLLPDHAPASPPAAIAGEPLPGVVPALLPDQITTAISPKPQVIFYQPGVHSDVGLSLVTGTGPLTSGTPVLITLAENYNFYSGDKIATAPYIQDIVLFNYNRPELTAAFAVTPSFEFEALTPMEGVIDLDAFAPTDTQRDLMIVGPAGGTVTTATGESLTLPEGAVSDYVPVKLELPAEDDLEFEWPAGLNFVTGVSVGFGGSHLALPALLSTPVPQGFVNQGQLLLVRLEEVQGVTRLVVIGKGEVQGDNIVAEYGFSGDPDVRLPGITEAGRYLFLQTVDAVGFVSGTVFDTTGDFLAGAIVTTNTLPVVALSQSNGTYVTAAGIGPVYVTALDSIKMNSGTASGVVPAAGDLVYVDVALIEAPPQVVSFSPVDGQLNVPLGTAVSLTFSEPLDAATVTTANLILTGPAGPVPGTLSLAANNTRVTFRPTDPLVPDRTYVFSVMTGIRDLAGYSFEEIFSFSFTTLDTVAPLPPPAGNINASIPGDDGKSSITTTQGTAGVHDTVKIINKTRNTSTPVLVEADGSFSGAIEAGILDEVVISITDTAGNETEVTLGHFKNSDGRAVIGPEGGQLEADNGIILTIPPGAFPDGAVVKITAVPEEDIGTSPGSDFPFVAGFEIESSVKPEIYLNASAPLPANAGPQSTGIVANVLTAFGKPALSIVDTAKVIDGRLATSSPPCQGILSKFDRYAMYLNEHELMQLGMAIVSMSPPATRTVVLKPYILPSFFVPILVHPGIKFDETYYPAYEFINMILEGKPVRGVMAVAEHPYYCLPVPADVPLKVVVRDADTGEVVQAIDIPETGAGENVDITDEFLVSNDIDPPEVVMTEWSPDPPHILDPGKLIALRLSEPVQLKGENPVYLIDEETQQVINGDIELLANNRVIVFIPDQALPLGKSYRVVMEGVEDLAGNAYEDPPGENMTFSTFMPYIISKLHKEHVAAGLGTPEDSLTVDIDGYSMVFTFGLKDLDFTTRRPSETSSGLWETHISAVRRDRGYGPALLTIDASDPLEPIAVGGVGDMVKYRFGDIEVFDDLYLEPRDSDYVSLDYWGTRQLHYLVNDPSIRICGEPGSQEIADWRAMNCQEDEDCKAKTGGCGDLAVVSATQSTDYAWLNLYDVTDLSNPKLISFRALSENRGGATSYSQDMWWAPAGMGFAGGLSVLQNIDITHKRPILIPGWFGDDTMTHEDTIGAYVAVENIGIELVDIGLNFPQLNKQHERLNPDNPGLYIEHYESLGLNSHLYYRDVEVVAGKVVAVSGDELDGTNIRFLEVFNLDLSGPVYPPLQIPYHIPEKLKSTAGYLPLDQDGNGLIDPHEIIFTSGVYGGVTVILMYRENIPPEIVGFYRTPFDVRTKHIEIDPDNKLAYVGAQWKEAEKTIEGILVLDIRNPAGGPFDKDGDEWDDRIIGKIKITGTADIPLGTVEGFRFDSERRMIYAAIQSLEACLVTIKTCSCPGIVIPSEDASARAGSVSVNLNSGSVTVGGEDKIFESDDGITGNLFVHAVPSQGGEVCANLDIEITPGLEIRYQITEKPLSGDPNDTMLDLSGGADAGVLSPSNPDICLSVRPSENMPPGSYVFLDIQDTAGNFLDRLLLTVTPASVIAENIRLQTIVDRINGDICGGFAALRFDLSHEAEVTIRVDGDVIDQMIAGEVTPMQDILLPPGLNQVTILKDMVPNPGEHDFEITAVYSRQDPNIQAAVNGKIVHDIVINESLPVGHSSVKGIDLMDGHLSIVRKDFAIGGLGPDLQFARSYGSVGNRSSGPIGAGWSHNYDSRLVFDSCGHITVLGGEGSGTRFFNPAPDVDDQGQPILRYQPQAGYHGILHYYQNDDSYDFYTKSRTRYHYEQEPEPTASSNYTLRFIEDSFGNRLTLQYDQNPPYNLIAVRDASDRTLEFTYDGFGTVPEDRLVQISGPLGLVVNYEYDNYGNLTRATRDIRSESYEYSTDHPRDKHNMTRITDPNGNSTEYVYYSDQDPVSGFPGDFDWDTHVLVFPENYEFVRAVVEGSGSPEQETIQFSYNYADHQEKILTTVVDAWNVTTLHTMNPRGGAVEKRVYIAGGDNISRTKWAYEEGINDVYMTENIEPNGRITRFSYDSNGNLTEQTIDLSNLTGYEPVLNGDQSVTQITNRNIFDQRFNKPVQSVDSMGNITDYDLDPQNGAVLSKTTYPQAGEPITLGFTYYPNGLPETTTDGRGSITRFTEYDAHGNNTKVIDPLGNETTMVYDERSRLIESSDSMGHRSRTEYDELDNVVSVTRFSGSASDDRTVTYTYYPNGKKRTQTDGLNHATEYFYDGLARLVKKIDYLQDLDGNPLSYEWTYTLDSVSRTTVKTGPRGVGTTSHMDELHRLTEVSIQGPFGPQQVLSRFEYDPVGNKISETALTGAVTTYGYDGLYRMVRKTLPISNDNQTYTEQFAFDLAGNKLSETNANGNQIQYEYDNTYRLTTHIDALGNTARYIYDNNGNMVENTQETRGLLTQSEYDLLNRLTVQTQTFTDPITHTEINYVSRMQYNDAAHTQTMTDAAGKKALEVFDGLDQLVSKTVDPGVLNLTTEFNYDANGNITSTTDPEGTVFESTYDGLNRRVLSRYLPQNFEESFRYDGADLLIEHTDKRGIVTEYTYDNLGRRRHMLLQESITQSGQVLNLKEYIYEDQSPQGPRMIEIDARGNNLAHVYDLMGREIRTIDPMGNEIRQEYDGINRIAGIDQRSIRTQYEFDALNRLTRIIDPNGAFTETRYLDNLNQALVIDKKGIQTRYQYDPLERLRQVTASLISETSFDIVTETKIYRADDLFFESIDANGNITRYEYDNAGRLVAQISAFGSADETSTTMTYDGAGRTLSVKQGRVHGADYDMTYIYDDENRTVRAVDAEGNETLTTIDGGKNILSVTKPNGNQELRTYDELGKLLTVTDALGNVTRLEYDNNRNLVMQEDANGNRVNYEFDATDRLTDIFQVVDANTSRHTQNSYDVAGNLLETIDPKGQHTNFEYNDLNLLTSKTYSNHVDPVFPHILKIEYDYDLNDNTTEVHEINRISNTGDPGQDEMFEITTMQYDNLNRLVEINNSDGKTVQYGYDSNGNRTSLTGPDSLITKYVFDAMNRLIRTDAAEGSTIHTYHPDGLPLQTIFPNGIRTENDYDNAGRFTEIRHMSEDSGPDGIPGTADDQETILFRLAYTYDGNGNPLTQTFEGPGTPSETTGFTYGMTDRMTQVDYPNEGIIDYSYDAVGNRLTEIGTDPLDGNSPVNRTYGYDTLNQLIQVSDLADSSGSVALEYDFNGNLIRKTTDGVSVEFDFDIRDQLTSTADTLNGGNILFDYDYEGLRTKKISSAGETRYLYDGGSVLAEYDGSPGFATLRKYSYGRGLLSLTDHSVPNGDPSHTQFYLTDALGSTICMANTGGATQKTYKYDAWGNLLSQEGNSGNPRTFTGHFFDDETGMFYFGARYYDSRLGRFISQDPNMGDTATPMSLHRYLYANANPMRYIDLDGYESVSFTDIWTKHASGVVSGINKAGQEMITETGAMASDVGMGAIKMLLLSPKQRRAVEKSPYLSRARSHIGRQIQDGVPLKQVLLESVEGIVMTPIKFVGSLTDTSISPEERGKLLFGTVASVASIYGGVKTSIRIGKKVRATTHSVKAGYQALKLMKRKRVSKRFDPKVGDLVPTEGAFVFKDAYNLAKAGVKAGKLQISGGLTGKAATWGGSARNLLSNLKESFKGRTSLRSAKYSISKGKKPGDIDVMVGGRNIPKVMADTKWARELNRQAGVPLYDITPGHGINGLNMPYELMGGNLPIYDFLKHKIYRQNPKLLNGHMVKAGPYLERGLYFTGKEAKMLGGPAAGGRYSVIVKHGKPVFRKPQKVIYYNRAPEIPLGWLDPVESMLGGPHTPWRTQLWVTNIALGTSNGLSDED